jgi:hypothetical protein
LEEYETLGKLIKQGTIDEPVEPDRSTVNLADEFEIHRGHEDMPENKNGTRPEETKAICNNPQVPG